MQYIAAIVALAATASAHAVAYNNTVPTPEPVHEPAYVTEVVQDYTTVCPYATELTVGGKTYTVTEATTLTISDCSCTVSYEAPTPSAGYGSPAHPSAGYGSPAHPSAGHGSPAHPSAGYGSPAHPSAGYGHPGHPSAGYGAPIVTGPGYSAPAANPTGAHPTPAAPYPTNGYGHSNGTAGVPVGTATRPVATGPAPQYTGAASKAGVALLGLAGAGLAAFL